MDEQKLRQLFKNRANCYTDADDVIQAMDEDCFIKTVTEALRIHDVVGRSEQSICTSCKSDIAEEFIPKCYCPECGNEWGK